MSLELVSLGGVGVVAIGLIITWARNGKSQAKSMGAMEARFTEQIRTIFEKLDNDNNGLGAIKKSVDEQKQHCASVTGGYEERLKGLERQRQKEDKV